MRILKYTAPAAILMSGLFLSTVSSYGKPEFTKQTKKPCTLCHVDAKKNPKDLTAAGKYFKEHNHSLEGYEGK